MRTFPTRRDASRLGNEAGFTLPELMVTVLVMGILFAIATTSWQNIIEGRRVTSATNQVIADLRLANTSASNQLAEHFVVVPAASGGELNSSCAQRGPSDPPPYPRYCLIKRDAASGTIVKTPRYLPDGTTMLGSSVNVTNTSLPALSVLGIGNGTKALRFNADGSADAPSGLPVGTTAMTVTVGSTDGNRSSVLRVNQATSRVRLQ